MAAPLTEDDLAALDVFLLSDACDDNTLSIDEAHGYLTALLVGPETVPEAEWMGEVWGEPRFDTPADEEHLTGLLRRMHDDIADGLAKGLTFEPLIVEEEEEGELFATYEGWCFGFMLGVERNEREWQPLPKDEQALLAPMAQLALLGSEEDSDMDEEEYESWVELIPGAVTGLYQYWHAAKH